MGLAKTFNELPPWAKGVTAVVVVGGGAITILTGYNLIRDELAKKKDKELIKESQKDIDTLQAQGVTATHTSTEYKILADSIDTACQGWGTDYHAIYSAFKKIKNDLDFNLLIQSFGVRKISSGNFNPTPDFTGNLAQVLANELLTFQLDELNKLLSDDGVKYQF